MKDHIEMFTGLLVCGFTGYFWIKKKQGSAVVGPLGSIGTFGTLVVLGLFGLFGLFPDAALAYAPLTFRHEHHLFSLDPDSFPEWRSAREVWTYEGKEISPPRELRVDGDMPPSLPPGISRTRVIGWDPAAIRATVSERIASKLDRVAHDVTIRKSSSGSIVFDGVGMLGRTVDSDRTTELTIAALTQGIAEIALPVREEQPLITVLDPALQAQGIREIVTVGESDFSGSPIPRRHNIAIGLSKFNGHLIPQGATFSFNEVLGKVDASTGYWKELVIMGEHTLPEYGGGLCQVSTTAYRGVWKYGFPITQRKNHSFAVRYYAPDGTDATIFPPNTDMKFANDSPSALLIQTHQENDHAYFVYYGTHDARKSEIIGPYTWDFRAPPPDREEFTTDIPPGETRKASDRHPGLKALWFRVVQPASGSGGEVVEQVFSAYQARGFLTQIGIEAPPEEETESSQKNASSVSSASSSTKGKATPSKPQRRGS